MKKLSIINIIYMLVFFANIFFHKFYINEKKCFYIKDIDGFYPSGYTIIHSEKSLHDYLYCNKDSIKIASVMKHKFDFKKHSYIFVYGAKINKMYYSVKTTLFDDISPYWASARRQGKQCLFIEYKNIDNKMYIYEIDKRNYLASFGGC